MQIAQGYVLVQRFFDVGDTIDLPMAARLASHVSQRAYFADASQHIRLPSPPLEISPPHPTHIIPSLEPCQTSARLYSIGAVVITFKIPFPPLCTYEKAMDIALLLQTHHTAITQHSKEVCQAIVNTFAKAITPGGLPNIVEDYTVFYVQSFNAQVSAEHVLNTYDIPRLLLAEQGPLAQTEKHHLLKSSFSYRPDDLAVIDWNSAFVWDPTGSNDVPEILEFATVQLLELQAYDALAAEALNTLYQALDPNHKTLFFSSKKYIRLSQKVMQHFIEVSEIAEKIDHALTFLADTWLARVHQAASKEFGIPRWHAQLRNKLEMLRQINTMLVDRVTSQKSLSLEIAIVGLIVLEIMLALF